MPKVSVIIPIYNVENYLERCLDSIIKNELSDIEIICVDDGSKDKSGWICDKYAEKDSRIKVIHKFNGGLSSARNAGMDMAAGKYIFFIDPDDDIEQDMLFKMVSIGEKENCEVVLCGYKTMPGGNEVIPLYELNRPLKPKEMIMKNNKVHSHNDLSFTWRFLFKRRLIRENNIRFNEKILFAEDFTFNLEVLLKAKIVYVLGESLYHYTINNQESIMRTPYKKHMESSLILQYDIKNKLAIDNGLTRHKEYMDDMAYYYINAILPMMIKNLYNGPEEDKKAGVKRILSYKMFHDSCKQIGLLNKYSNFKEYIVYLAIKYKFYSLVYYAFNKNIK